MSTFDKEQFIRDAVKTHFGREVTDISTLTGGSNTFTYKLEVEAAKDTDLATPGTVQPGTSPLPAHAVPLVFRLGNPGSMLDLEVRVQSEVALMALMRDALSSLDTQLVPAVYAWNDDDKNRGWILTEFMPGVSPVGTISELPPDGQRKLVGDMAQIVKAIQDYELPVTARGFGGLRFDADGHIVIGATPIAGGGPCDTLRQLYFEYFQTQLDFADGCDIVQGWTDTDLRARLDEFAAQALQPLLESLPLDGARPTLVHADFDVHNLLFDPETNRLTALLDYDFGHVGAPASEYLYSFPHLSYIVTPPNIDEPGLAKVRQRLLHGFEAGDAAQKGETVDWELAVMMDEELRRVGADRPQDIAGMDELATLHWFIQDLSPGIFFLERWRAKATPAMKARIRQSTQSNLDWYLKRWGY